MITLAVVVQNLPTRYRGKEADMKTRLLPLMIGLLLLSAAISPLNAAAVSDPTGTDAPLPECFQQTDERWAGKELIGPNGCGLIALVNAVNYLTGNFIDPVELAVYAHRIDAYNGSLRETVRIPRNRYRHGRGRPPSGFHPEPEGGRCRCMPRLRTFHHDRGL